MDTTWKERVLQLAHRSTGEEDREYVTLVYQVEGQVTLEIARILMQTFSDEPDHGVQESVCAVLASADPEIYMQALLEELPRLHHEADEWAEVLVGSALNFSHNALLKVAKRINPSLRTTLLEVITRFSLQEETEHGQQMLEVLLTEDV